MRFFSTLRSSSSAVGIITEGFCTASREPSKWTDLISWKMCWTVQDNEKESELTPFSFEKSALLDGAQKIRIGICIAEILGWYRWINCSHSWDSSSLRAQRKVFDLNITIEHLSKFEFKFFSIHFGIYVTRAQVSSSRFWNGWFGLGLPHSPLKTKKMTRENPFWAGRRGFGCLYFKGEGKNEDRRCSKKNIPRFDLNTKSAFTRTVALFLLGKKLRWSNLCALDTLLWEFDFWDLLVVSR